MLSTSTYFIKGQLPGISMDKLIELYSKELRMQQISITKIDGNLIEFINDSTNIFLVDRTADNFQDIAEGQITIEETDAEFIVYLDAKATNPIGALIDKLTFPMYFESLRNDIEQQIRSIR
jgi:hypothetical protein